MVHPALRDALVQHYQSGKLQYPSEGRRKLCLRVLHASWSSLSTLPGSTAETSLESIASEADPLDGFLDSEEPGLVIRADFTNEEAWGNFLPSVQSAQKDVLADLRAAESQADGSSNPPLPDDVAMAGPASVYPPQTDEEEDSSDSSYELPELIRFIEPSDPTMRALLTNISNIRALRLFNDVDIRRAPPATSRRVPPNTLIDQGGWQEIYTGKNIWIYDTQSNVDQCARMVSQQGDFYGTATGDSWRARGSHIPELQFSMAFRGLKIDFNGLDKWDYPERQRNLSESAQL